MVSEALVQHSVLDAILFVLSGVRYLWGPPTDILRLGLFLICGWAAIGDMDIYYGWAIALPSLGGGGREVITKLAFIATLLIDLGRDYFQMRFLRWVKDMADVAKENP